VVLRIPAGEFEFELQQLKQWRNLHCISNFTELDFIELTKVNKAITVRKTGRPFPQEPFDQLRRVLGALFTFQCTNKVTLFKQSLHLSSSTSGAVIVQPMVYGNNGRNSLSLLVASRDLSTGENKINGDYLVNATTDDVANSIEELQTLETLATESADVHKSVIDIAQQSEKFFKPAVLLSFVAQDGTLYCVDVVPAQFTTPGKFKSIRDLVVEEIKTRAEGLDAIHPSDVIQFITPQILVDAPPSTTTGLSAGQPCVVGKLCLT
jgi:pyruvate,orthophosphate dikinase